MANKTTVSATLQVNTEVNYKSLQELKNYLENITTNYTFKDSNITKGFEKALKEVNALEKTMKNTLKSGSKVSTQTLNDSLKSGKALEKVYESVLDFNKQVNAGGGFDQFANSFIEAKNKIEKEIISLKNNFKKNNYNLDFDSLNIDNLHNNINNLKNEINELKNNGLNDYIDEAYNAHDQALQDATDSLEKLNKIREEAKKIQEKTLMSYAPVGKGIKNAKDFENKAVYERRGVETIFNSSEENRNIVAQRKEMENVLKLLEKSKNLEDAKKKASEDNYALLMKYEDKIAASDMAKQTRLKKEIKLLEDKEKLRKKEIEDQLESSKEIYQAYKKGVGDSVKAANNYVKDNAVSDKTLTSLDKTIQNVNSTITKENSILTEEGLSTIIAEAQAKINDDITYKQNQVNEGEKIINNYDALKAIIQKNSLSLKENKENEKALEILNEISKKQKDAADFKYNNISKEHADANLAQILADANISKGDLELYRNTTLGLNRTGDDDIKERVVRLEELKKALIDDSKLLGKKEISEETMQSILDAFREEKEAIESELKEIIENLKSKGELGTYRNDYYEDIQKKFINNPNESQHKNKKRNESEESLSETLNIVKNNNDAMKKGVDNAEEYEQLLSKISQRFSYIFDISYIFEKIVNLTRQAIQTTISMDKDMAQIGLVLGETSGEVWKNFNTYSKMAEKLGSTTQQVTASMKLFYQQGLSTAEVNKMVEASAIAAALGESTLAEASETLTSIINSYNLSATDAMTVTDKISAISIKSAADFGELSTAIEKVASSAATAGLDLDHMMGYLAKAIETTREAPANIGTFLKTITANFTQFNENPDTANEDGFTANDVDQALKDIGISLFDTSGKMRDLGDVIDELGGKWDDLSRNQKAYLATAIAG